LGNAAGGAVRRRRRGRGACAQRATQRRAPLTPRRHARRRLKGRSTRPSPWRKCGKSRTRCLRGAQRFAAPSTRACGRR
jgi:hypothetical protein